MNNDDFYENLDLRYPELGIALSGTSGSSRKIKMYIPTLMAFVDDNNKTPKRKVNKSPSKSNILNKEPIALSNTISKNYITIQVPEYLGRISKGTKLVVVFIGGDITQPVVIGRC